MSDTFSTTFLFLAAYLHCRGYELLRVVVRGKQATFLFPRADALDRDLSAFNSGATVDVAQYVGSIGYVKRALREALAQDSPRDNSHNAAGLMKFSDFFPTLRDGIIRNLRGSRLHIWLAYRSHANREGLAWPSNELLRQETGYSLRVVKAEKAWLIEKI